MTCSAKIASDDGEHVYCGVRPRSPKLLRLYADADVFVLPTPGDCLAAVLGEAMASSLPIITTRVGAHAEAVREGESGFVIDVDDAEALQSRLGLLAKNPDLCARLGARSRQIGEERFDMTKNANRIADLLLEMLQTGRARSNGRS